MSVLGHHSAGELRDWLAALDYQLGQIAAAYSAFAPAWRAQSPEVFADWTRDWQSLQARYAAAHAAAHGAITRATYTPLPESVVPVEDEWQRVHAALVQAPDGTMSKGDFQDLYNRLAAARGAGIDLSKTPQPTAPDADLSAYQTAGAVLRAGEELAHRAEPNAGTKWLIGGGVVLGLGLLVRSVLR